MIKSVVAMKPSTKVFSGVGMSQVQPIRVVIERPWDKSAVKASLKEIKEWLESVSGAISINFTYERREELGSQEEIRILMMPIEGANERIEAEYSVVKMFTQVMKHLQIHGVVYVDADDADIILRALIRLIKATGKASYGKAHEVACAVGNALQFMMHPFSSMKTEVVDTDEKTYFRITIER